MLLRHFQFQSGDGERLDAHVRTTRPKRLPDEGASDGVVFTGKPWRFLGSSAVGESRASALKLTSPATASIACSRRQGPATGHGHRADRRKISLDNERALGLHHAVSRAWNRLAARHNAA